MAERPDPIRRIMDANARYYEALGQVYQEYVNALIGVMRDLPVRFGPKASRPAGPATPVSAQPTASTTAATLVLEAALDEEAQGVFLVENKLGRTVSTAVMTSAFADPSGRAFQPTFRIVPSVVTLEAGHRTLVQIFAVITDAMEIDVPYRGEISVPGLSDHGIPVVLRRTEATAEQPAKKRTVRSRSKKTAAKKGSKKSAAKKVTVKRRGSARAAGAQKTRKKSGAKKAPASKRSAKRTRKRDAET